MNAIINLINRLFRRPVKDPKLCPKCARGNRRAYYRLIYEFRGRHTCDKCGCEFTVTSEVSAA
jgi:transposase-like protein